MKLESRCSNVVVDDSGEGVWESGSSLERGLAFQVLKRSGLRLVVDEWGLEALKKACGKTYAKTQPNA